MPAMTKRYLWIISLVLLTACGTVPLASPAPTNVDSTAIVVQAAATANAQLTQITALQPTATLKPTISPPTATLAPTRTPWPTPSEPLSLDKLRRVYVKDDDLYVQDGLNFPVQLTFDKANPYSAQLSDDGEKTVFLLRDNRNIYSINIDGSHEQVLVSSTSLAAFGMKYDDSTKVGSLVFVPGTHLLLFNIYSCTSQSDKSTSCNTGLFLVNTDTSKITQILLPTLIDRQPFNGISPMDVQVSPNGKLISVAMSGHIDLLNMDGKIVRRNILTYTRSSPIELIPRQYWLSDSSGLIIAIPKDDIIGGGPNWQPPTYTVWRYILKSNIANQIALDPLPRWIYMDCGDIIYVSPDGNQVVYNSWAHNTGDELFVGNLKDGTTQSYPVTTDCSRAHWSPNSAYFIYGYFNETVLGAAGKPLVSLGHIAFLNWIDATHFAYTIYEVSSSESGSSSKTYSYIGNINGQAFALPENFYWSSTFIILTPASGQ